MMEYIKQHRACRGSNKLPSLRHCKHKLVHRCQTRLLDRLYRIPPALHRLYMTPLALSCAIPLLLSKHCSVKHESAVRQSHEDVWGVAIRALILQ